MFPQVNDLVIFTEGEKQYNALVLGANSSEKLLLGENGEPLLHLVFADASRVKIKIGTQPQEFVRTELDVPHQTSPHGKVGVWREPEGTGGGGFEVSVDGKSSTHHELEAVPSPKVVPYPDGITSGAKLVPVAMTRPTDLPDGVGTLPEGFSTIDGFRVVIEARCPKCNQWAKLSGTALEPDHVNCYYHCAAKHDKNDPGDGLGGENYFTVEVAKEKHDATGL